MCVFFLVRFYPCALLSESAFFSRAYVHMRFFPVRFFPMRFYPVRFFPVTLSFIVTFMFFLSFISSACLEEILRFTTFLHHNSILLHVTTYLHHNSTLLYVTTSLRHNSTLSFTLSASPNLCKTKASLVMSLLDALESSGRRYV